MIERCPKKIESFIKEITSIEPIPDEVWLIGSWANKRAKYNSDIDLLVFACEDYIRSLKRNTHEPANIDVLIVYDGENFRDPCKNKTGSLHSWEWKLVSEDEARYRGTKFIVDEESTNEFCGNKTGVEMGSHIVRDEKAILLWRKP